MEYDDEIKKKRKKITTDPKAPERPQSAFFLWLTECQQSIEGEYPERCIAELSRVAVELWEEMEGRTVKSSTPLKGMYVTSAVASKSV